MVNHSDVNVHVEYLGVRKIYELVLSGEVDIGLVAVPRRDRRLEVYDFAEEPLALACSPKHAFAAETEIDIHKLQFERFIGFDSTVPTRGWIDSILERYSDAARLFRGYPWGDLPTRYLRSYPAPEKIKGANEAARRRTGGVPWGPAAPRPHRISRL